MHYFHAELRRDGFFGRVNVTFFQGGENLLLRERRGIYIILLQLISTVYNLTFRDIYYF